jgi:hypothetical protein
LDKASKGDIIFFHYSGHGYQIPDNNNDELDEFDESLVPEDAPFDKGKQYPETYYENYIRDDELAVMLDLLRSKVGVTGNVFVTIDACHSGSATRGFGSKRGEVREKSINFIPPPSARVENSNDDFGLYNSGDNKSPMTCILASSEEELNYEYQVSDSLRVGSLSFAFSKALTETNNNVSYRVLFEKIKNIMVSIAPRQTPHAEGEFDQLIFGGQLLSRTSYLKIKDILNNKRVIINGGILHGILPGTIVGFYPPDTRDLSSVKAIAVGKVVDNRTIESTIELTEGELSSDKDYLTWVFILEKNFGDMTLNMHVSTRKREEKVEWLKLFENYPFIKIVNEKSSELLLEVGQIDRQNMDEVRLITKEGYVTFTDKYETPMSMQSDAILRKVIGYVQAKMLRSLEMDNPDMDVEVRLIPMKLKAGATGKNLNDFEEIDPKNIYKQPANKIEISEGTIFKFGIKNNSSFNLYFSILDIQPNNEISLLFPRKGRYPKDYVLSPTSEWIEHSAIFKANPPYGEDLLKIILTRVPLELESIVTTRGADNSVRSRPLSNFEKILSTSYRQNISARGPEMINLEVENIAVYNLIYKIMPKQ